MTVLKKRRGAQPPVTAQPHPASPVDLQGLVDAELDAQVLLLPQDDGFQITHSNAEGQMLLNTGDDVLAVKPLAVACDTVWDCRRGVNLVDLHWPGAHRWFDARVRYLSGRLSVTLTDVTGRHMREAALMDSQCRYRMLAENADDLVFQVRGKRLEWVSSSVRTLLGWDEFEVVGKRVADLVHPDDRLTVIDACATASEPAAYTARFRHREGRWVWLSVVMRPAVDLGGCLARVGSGRSVVEEPAVDLVRSTLIG